MAKMREGLQSWGFDMNGFAIFENQVKDHLWSCTTKQTSIGDFLKNVNTFFLIVARKVVEPAHQHQHSIGDFFVLC